MFPLTFTPGVDDFPVWAPDGKHMAFRSDRHGGEANIYWIRADGSGEAQRLTESKNQQIPTSFSPDGKGLAFDERGSETGWDIWTQPLDLSDPDHPKPGKPEPFLCTPFSERYSAFSPDGRWLAYSANDSGSFEVYVRPFPGPGGKWLISTGGGTMPVWSRIGWELFYRTEDGRIMVATYSAKRDAFVADKPRPWSDKGFRETALAPDGKHFVVLGQAEETGEQKALTHVTFLLNFFDELRRRDAAGGAK